MAAPVLTAAAVIVCPHGGTVAAATATSRVLVGGVPVLTVGATATVQNCAVPPPGEACKTVTWPTGAARVVADGKPVLIQPVAGLCLSAAGGPAGAPLVVAVQSRVLAG